MYGVGSGPVAVARRFDASAIKLSSSLSFGTTCLATMILSNSLFTTHVSLPTTSVDPRRKHSPRTSPLTSPPSVPAPASTPLPSSPQP